MIVTQLHDGRIFESMSAADRALGVSIGTTSEHLDRYGHTENIGKHKKNNAREITIGPDTYPSIAAASRATGLSRYEVNRMRGYRKPKKRRPTNG